MVETTEQFLGYFVHGSMAHGPWALGQDGITHEPVGAAHWPWDMVCCPQAMKQGAMSQFRGGFLMKSFSTTRSGDCETKQSI